VISSCHRISVHTLKHCLTGQFSHCDHRLIWDAMAVSEPVSIDGAS